MLVTAAPPPILDDHREQCSTCVSNVRLSVHADYSICEECAGAIVASYESMIAILCGLMERFTAEGSREAYREAKNRADLLQAMVDRDFETLDRNMELLRNLFPINSPVAGNRAVSNRNADYPKENDNDANH